MSSGAHLTDSKSNRSIESFIKNPSHALLIVGSTILDATATAEYITKEILKLEQGSDVRNHPIVLYIDRPTEKQDISIDSVRQIVSFMKLKIASSTTLYRLVIINQAQTMSLEAQNALLKALEEPSPQTIFLLAVGGLRGILPTVASRCQKLRVDTLSWEQAELQFNGTRTKQELREAWLLSEGSFELMSAILIDSSTHPLKEQVARAKDFLGSSQFERLNFLEILSKDKEIYAQFLEILSRVLSTLHHLAIERDRSRQAKSLLMARKVVISTSEDLKFNVSLRLLNLRLANELNI